MFWGRLEPECLPEIFSRSAETVMPSRYEPFGIVGLEAMACGSPLVASDVNGLAHVMLRSYAPRPVPPGNAEALAWTLAGFLRRRGQQSVVARNARIWAGAFSMTEVARRFRSLYAGESPPPHRMGALASSRSGCLRTGRATLEPHCSPPRPGRTAVCPQDHRHLSRSRCVAVRSACRPRHSRQSGASEPHPVPSSPPMGSAGPCGP